MGRLGVRIEARPLSKVDRSRSRVSRSRAGDPRARPPAPRSGSRAILARPPRRQPRESIVELSSGAIARQVSWQVSLLNHRLRISVGLRPEWKVRTIVDPDILADGASAMRLPRMTT